MSDWYKELIEEIELDEDDIKQGVTLHQILEN